MILKNLQVVISDAITIVIELYDDMGKQFPAGIVEESSTPVWFESLIPADA